MIPQVVLWPPYACTNTHAPAYIEYVHPKYNMHVHVFPTPVSDKRQIKTKGRDRLLTRKLSISIMTQNGVSSPHPPGSHGLSILKTEATQKKKERDGW